MRAEDIRHTQHGQPFVPFVLHLADGRQFQIPHPEFMWVAPNGRRLTLEAPDGNMEIIDPLMVTSITVPAAQPRGGNGQ
jgi:hypothetical protein